MDRVLLLIEAAAVLGLVALGVTMLQSIGTLQDETARAQLNADAQIRASIPTIVPTPVLQLAEKRFFCYACVHSQTHFRCIRYGSRRIHSWVASSIRPRGGAMYAAR